MSLGCSAYSVFLVIEDCPKGLNPRTVKAIDPKPLRRIGRACVALVLPKSQGSVGSGMSSETSFLGRFLEPPSAAP